MYIVDSYEDPDGKEIYVVGFWHPDDSFYTEVTCESREVAREYCSWLNGGKKPEHSERYHHILVTYPCDLPQIRGGFLNYSDAAKWARRFKIKLGSGAEFFHVIAEPGRLIEVDSFIESDLDLEKERANE